MLRFRPNFSRRFAAIALACGTTITGVAAATLHRYAVSQSTGSGGATAFVQSGSASGSALQGEVASSANTGIAVPFGLLGEYNASGSTFGAGTLGISTTGYGVAGESLSDSQPGILAYNTAGGDGLDAVTGSKSGANAISAVGGAVGVNAQGFQAVIGTDGVADSGYGIYGTSNVGTGVYGSSGGFDGVFGVNTATATPSPSMAPASRGYRTLPMVCTPRRSPVSACMQVRTTTHSLRRR